MRLYLEEAEKWERKKQDVFSEINSAKLPLVLFGRSSTINPAFLQNIHVPVEYVCSNTPSTWGTQWWDRKVINPFDLPGIYQDYNVLILIARYETFFTSQLQSLDIPPKKIFSIDLSQDNNMADAQYYQGRHEEINRIYDCLCDQKSKDTYEAMIHYRINRIPTLVSPVALPTESQYFPAALDGSPFLSDREVFVDCGAFTGDTVEGFIKAVNYKYTHIYALEPDTQNYQKMLDFTQNVENLTSWPFGVGAEDGSARFFAKGISSKLSEAGDIVVQIRSLDKLLKGVPVTYIKMDIEGAECSALRGAEQLIKLNKPKLAICMYHSKEDMIDVPLLILKLNPEYKLYIRHYTQGLCDTVCYAI